MFGESKLKILISLIDTNYAPVTTPNYAKFFITNSTKRYHY